jgi:ECF transporter S component (folate family)
VFAGIILGPVHGLLVGILSDVTGHVLVPAGAYLWQLTLISGLYGVIPWFFYRLPRPKSTAGRIWLGVTISRVILNVGWLPFVLHDINGIPYVPGVLAQAALSVVLVPALGFLTIVLLRVYERSGFAHVRS